MKVGDFVRMDCKDHGPNEWRDSYTGVIVGEHLHYNKKVTEAWKVLVADGDGTSIGYFACDFWNGTVINEAR